MSTNTLDFASRLEVGKQKEKLVFDLLSNIYRLPNNSPAITWYPSSSKLDIKDKIDGFVETQLNANPQSIQIKIRETGGDMGLALYRPWKTFDDFKANYPDAESNLALDRDHPFYHKVDWYVLLVEESNVLIISSAETVKKVVKKMLNELYLEESFNGTFKKESLYGAELKLVTDAGNGGTGGQKKLICYIKPSLLKKLGNTDIYNYADNFSKL